MASVEIVMSVSGAPTTAAVVAEPADTWLSRAPAPSSAASAGERRQNLRRVLGGYRKAWNGLRGVLPSAFTVSSCAAAAGLSSSDMEEDDDVAMDKDSLFRFRADVAQLSRYLEKEKHNPP